jgi:hypothetical protein
MQIGIFKIDSPKVASGALSILDCGQGEVPYRIGDQLRAEPI